MRVVLTGTKEDIDYIDKIKDLTTSKPIVAAGKTTLMELANLINRCNVYITPDSAPMHIASAMGTPFIALFGPTDPLRHIAPSGNYIVIKKDMKCSPCYSPNCLKGFKCMKNITVEEVFGVTKEMLSKNAKAVS